MIFLLIAALASLLYGARLRDAGDASTWLNKGTTTAINGFFILFVFINHANQYIEASGFQYLAWCDASYKWLRKYIGQLIVAMFLFNSGYGVMESIKARGIDYVRCLPRHRILTVLANFDVAVLVFVALNVALGIGMNLRQIVLSFVCWDDVGNSNWYIFAILACYAITYIAFRFIRQRWKGLLLAVLGVVAFAVVMSFFKGSYWYNTVFAYPAGMAVSIFKERVFKFASDNWWRVTASLALMFFVGKFAVGHLPVRGLDHNCLTVVFVLLVAAICVRVDFGNEVSSWCGKNLFPLYIYQRIPMIVLASSSMLDLSNGAILFVLASFLLTLPIVFAYRYVRISL